MNQVQIAFEFWQEAFQRFEKGIEKGIGIFVFALIEAAKQFWFLYWPYIIAFFLVVIAGVILQILMLRSGGRSRLSSGFNRLVGSLTYMFFFCLQLVVSYWICGTDVIDEKWFALFGTLAYPVTGYFYEQSDFGIINLNNQPKYIPLFFSIILFCRQTNISLFSIADPSFKIYFA